MGWTGTIIDRMDDRAVVASTGTKSSWEEAQHSAERLAKRRGLRGDRYAIDVRDDGRDAVQTYLLRGIPDDLWRQIKAHAAMHGTTVRELLIDAIREIVKG